MRNTWAKVKLLLPMIFRFQTTLKLMFQITTWAYVKVILLLLWKLWFFYVVKVSLNKTDRDRTAAEYVIELSHLKTWASTPPTQQVHKKLQCPPLKIRCSCFRLQLVVLCAVAHCCCWQGKDVSVVSAWKFIVLSNIPTCFWLIEPFPLSFFASTHTQLPWLMKAKWTS